MYELLVLIHRVRIDLCDPRQERLQTGESAPLCRGIEWIRLDRAALQLGSMCVENFTGSQGDGVAQSQVGETGCCTHVVQRSEGERVCEKKARRCDNKSTILVSLITRMHLHSHTSSNGPRQHMQSEQPRGRRTHRLRAAAETHWPSRTPAAT